MDGFVGQNAGDGAGVPETDGFVDGTAAAGLSQVEFFAAPFGGDAAAVEIGGDAGPACAGGPRPGHVEDPFLFVGVGDEFADGFAGFVDGTSVAVVPAIGHAADDEVLAAFQIEGGLDAFANAGALDRVWVG